MILFKPPPHCLLTQECNKSIVNMEIITTSAHDGLKIAVCGVAYLPQGQYLPPPDDS